MEIKVTETDYTLENIVLADYSNANIVVESEDGRWMMKIDRKNRKIMFNREEFPDLTDDEFSHNVIKIMENIWMVGKN